MPIVYFTDHLHLIYENGQYLRPIGSFLHKIYGFLVIYRAEYKICTGHVIYPKLRAIDSTSMLKKFSPSSYSEKMRWEREGNRVVLSVSNIDLNSKVILHTEALRTVFQKKVNDNDDVILTKWNLGKMITDKSYRLSPNLIKIYSEIQKLGKCFLQGGGGRMGQLHLHSFTLEGLKILKNSRKQKMFIVFIKHIILWLILYVSKCKNMKEMN